MTQPQYKTMIVNVMIDFPLPSKTRYKYLPCTHTHSLKFDFNILLAKQTTQAQHTKEAPVFRITIKGIEGHF